MDNIKIKKRRDGLIENAINEIQRGVSEIIDLEAIQKLLKAYYEEGKNYTVKVGLDPTGADLHLGHTVLLQKLRAFQKHGAIVQLIIGDFTATIGDPTGKSETRKVMSPDAIAANAKTYQEQAFLILDRSKTEIYYNSKWFEKLGAAGIVGLSTLFSVARMLERDDFEKRYKSNQSISISEFLYPLLQGYDSVELKNDIELGGTDQKFNLLMGRHLQRSYDIGKEQAVITMPILEGLDGVAKMSKSLDNYIGITEDANTIYAKILSISDELMWRYYELLSTKSLAEIASIQKEVNEGSLHPKKAKEMLALELTQRFHDETSAFKAKEEFDNVFKSNQIPSDVEEFEIEGVVWICKVLVDANLESSTSQARRDIIQGAVKLNQEKIDDVQLQLEVGEYVIQVGKRKFAKIKVI
ncbi:MAG: tyrosine--tRNA ligase [Campylobacterales bacterium]|nr:tyrosine--tRNA ligase [Campylobacterales bacterium]